MDRNEAIKGYRAMLRASVDAWYAGRVDDVRFTARQKEIWAEIEAAGMSEEVSREIAPQLILGRRRN